MAMAKKHMKKPNTKEKKAFIQQTEIYHRLMRYPVFPASRRKKKDKIIHNLNEKGKVIALVSDATVEDFEKMVALINLLQNNKASRFDTSYTDDKGEKHEFSIVSTSLAELKKVLNYHSYTDIVKCLIRLSRVTIIYDFITSSGKHEKIIILPLFKVEVTEDNKIFVHFTKEFLDLFFDVKKSLFLDLQTLLKLSPYAKNLYMFLMANLDKREFNIDTLLERTLMTIDIEKKHHIQYLRRSIEALVKCNFIKKYFINLKERKVKITFSEKNKKNETSKNEE